MTGFSIKVTMKGMDKALKNIKEAQSKLPKAAASALHSEAEDIMKESKDNYVPILTGDLKDSGRVESPVVEGQRVLVVAQYGNEKTETYALVQHENLTLNHPGGKQAKYLERPFVQRTQSAGFVTSVSEKVRKGLGW
jgi:hypothetical protein